MAVPIQDFSGARRDLVLRLNRAGIPAIAWLLLPADQGYYLSADNAPQAAARIDAFEQWTRHNGLRWTAVGLDIEPKFGEWAGLRQRPWHLLATALRRSLNGGRIARARLAYTFLIHELQARGYVVQTYQMPYIPAERSVHSSLLDRLLGSVDVHGNEDYLMLYSSFARPAGVAAAMIYSLGRGAQDIAIGSTDGPGIPGRGSGPLDWNEFSRDLIVAGHFTRRIGIYDLEGCVRQGFLPRLEAMNWNATVYLPAAAVARSRRLGFTLRAALAIASNLLYLIAALAALTGWLVWRGRKRTRAAGLPTVSGLPTGEGGRDHECG